MARETRTNKISRLIGAAFLLAVGLGVLFIAMPGCDSSPAEPDFNNPFDPEGSEGGDPLNAWAEVLKDQPNTIRVWWNQPQGQGITKYEISHSDNPDSNWNFLVSVEATTDGLTFYDYTKPGATMTHWFRIQAKDDLGNFSDTSYATPGSTTIGPWVTVGPTYGSTSTRFPLVRIATSSGDSVRIALNSTYTDSLKVIGAPAVGDTAEITYDLGPATESGDTIQVYVQSFTGPTNSFTTSVPNEIKFRPNFKLASSGPTVATQLIDLVVPTEGVVQMRFANTADGLAAEPWVAVADTFFDFELTDSANRQSVWGEFDGDFGFVSDQIQLIVQPDLLENVTMKVKTSVSGTTGDNPVAVISSANATQMKIAEDPDFTIIPWVAFTDTQTVSISPGQGQKVVYAQYRNDFTQSTILADTFTYVPASISVQISQPLPDSLVVGNSTYIVQGVSSADAGTASVDRIEFEGGDGIWQPVTGLDTWTHPWDVPDYLTDTPVTIRARAWVADDYAIAAVTVTVTQLAVRIDDPLEGAQVLSDSLVTIAGRAASVTNGAAIDSITVDIGGDVDPVHILVSENESGAVNWSTTWTPQTVTAILNATITARAWVKGENVANEVNVTVAPQ